MSIDRFYFKKHSIFYDIPFKLLNASQHDIKIWKNLSIFFNGASLFSKEIHFSPMLSHNITKSSNVYSY